MKITGKSIEKRGRFYVCSILSSGKKIALLLAAAFFYFFTFLFNVYGETIHLNSLTHEEAIGKKISILKDPEGILKFDQVIQEIHSGRFAASDKDIPNFGFTSSVYWAHFTVANNTGKKKWLLEIAYPKLDHILYYIKYSNSDWQLFKTGDKEIFSKRPVQHRNFLFPMELLPEESAEILIRFESEGSHQYPIFISEEDAFNHEDKQETFIFGIYYGIVIILSFYNFILFLLVKDRSYLYYFLYISGFGFVMLNLNGLSYQIFWPDQPSWENRSLPFFIGWTFFWSLQFSKKFLNIRTLSPLINKIIYIIMGCMFFLMIFSLIIPYNYAISISAYLVICFSAVIFIAGFVSLKKQYRPARYFLTAWLIFLLGVVIYSLKGFGFILSNFFTDYGLQIGSALEMSLLSLGLGDRIQHINQEKQEAKLLAFQNERLYQESKIKSQRLELELLKKNIEPHFLLNSINATVVWMQEDPGTAVKLLNSLADELRTILNISGERMISAIQEIELCRSHLSVMSLRHAKEFSLDIKGNFTEDRIPPLIFHTIIENGISHGFRDRDSGKFILEKKIFTEDRFQYIITNNGSSEKRENKSSGLGFSFIKTRLAEVFPERWQLSYGPTDTGWEVTIEIKNEITRKKNDPV